MQTELSRELGIREPIFAFSYQPEVVAAVSRAGGFGVLGAVRFGGEASELEDALTFIEKECGGRPYGVNLVMPVKSQGVDAADLADVEAKLDALIPEEHRAWVEDYLERQGVPELPGDGEQVRGLLGWNDQARKPQLEVAFEHDAAVLASALGPPSKDVVEEAHRNDMLVAALVGRTDQALKQREQGVDIIVAQGHEAGGHTGEVTTMVLVPEVVDAVAPAPVLAAGGIGTGRQVAAALALGAQGVWTGSVWLGTVECQLPGNLLSLMWEASSSDTVRSRSLTGKPARQLRTDWLEAWEADDTPDPLQMPLQYLLTADALARLRAAGRHDLVGTPIGQIVGSMNELRTVAEVFEELATEGRRAIVSLRSVITEDAEPVG